MFFAWLVFFPEKSVAPKNCFVEVGLKMVEAIQIQLLGKNRRVTKEHKRKI